MPSVRLTEVQVRTAKTPPGVAQVDLWDATVRGLSLRVTTLGVKTFSLKYRNACGKEKRIKLGRYPDMSLADARAAAMEHRARIARGEDPAVNRLAKLTPYRRPTLTLCCARRDGRRA